MERDNRLVGVFLRETLPCSWLAYATSRLRDIEQPHLSPQHYELSGKQEVLNRTRVLVSKQCTKATSQQAWGKSLRRLNHTTRAQPNFNDGKAINPTHLQRERGREGENFDKLQTAS